MTDSSRDLNSKDNVSNAGTLNDSIKSICLQEDMADVFFVLKKDGNKKIPAHRVLLSARSPVFRAMFYGPLAETTKEISIPDISENAMTDFIR